MEDKINVEEKSRPDENLGALIIMEPPQEMSNMRLYFMGYSDELAVRRNGCFSNEDWRFIMQRIERIISALNN